MAFTKVASSSAAGAGTTVVINKPTGTAQNDIMFMILGSAAGTLGTTLSGWTLLESITSGTYSAVYYKVAGGSEGSTYTWAGFDGATYHDLVMVSYRGGFNVSSPIKLHAGNQDGNSVTMSCSLGDIDTVNSPIIFLTTVNYSGATPSITKNSDPISGWATDQAAVHNGQSTMAVFSAVWSSSGTFGSATATLDSSQLGVRKGTYAVALQAPLVYTLTADYGSFALTGYAALFKRIYTLVASYVTYTLTGSNAILTWIKNRFINLSKNSSNFSNQSKNSSSFTNQNKSSSNWINQDKS